MEGYEFKPKPEFLWFIGIAALTVVAQALVEFDPETITDWQAWAIALLAAVGRAVGGAFIAYMAKEGLTYDDEGEATP